jgi:hypothetical protein
VNAADVEGGGNETVSGSSEPLMIGPWVLGRVLGQGASGELDAFIFSVHFFVRVVVGIGLCLIECDC